MDLKKFFSNKKRNIVLIILALLLLTDLILGLVCRHIVLELTDQQTAERWGVDTNAAAVSLFFTEDQMVTLDSIKKLEYTMEKKMQYYYLTLINTRHGKLSRFCTITASGKLLYWTQQN